MKIADFIERYPPVGPQKPPDNPDQLRKLTAADGVQVLKSAPFPNPISGSPGTREGSHVWVIVPNDVPTILERAPVRPPLESGVVKHTNLTGGGPASCGGELWVDAASPDKLYLHGGSGRYPPRDRKHLEDAVRVFEGLGFSVECAGWSTENDVAQRVFR